MPENENNIQIGGGREEVNEMYPLAMRYDYQWKC